MGVLNFGAVEAVGYTDRMLPTVLVLLVAVMGQSDGRVVPSDLGSVNGTVTNEEGKAVAGATVYANPIDRPIIGIVPHSETDATGHFAIHGLPWGRYGISAKKEEDGYPGMLFEFFARNHATQKVTLGPDNPTTTVTIRLGPKAGKLTGTVTDAVTTAPLNPCVEFRWASDPSNSLTGSGLVNAKFSVLIPSTTDVLWKVWLDGYKPWYYPGTTDKSMATSLRLQPGQAKAVTIKLQPDTTAEKTGCGMPVGTVIKP